jgi:S-formylglutathione hydrolase FrmB
MAQTDQKTAAEILPGWEVVDVAGHPCDVFTPESPNPHGFLTVYLHGVHLGRLVDNPVATELLAAHGLPCLAPMTQRSWWTDKLCEEFDPKHTAERYLLDHVMPYVAERWGAKPSQTALFGTSMGGQGALRFAYKHPNRFPIVAALSPAIDYYTRYDEGDETIPLMYADPESARQDSAILHVHPLNWPRNQFFCCDPADQRWFDSADRLRMKLYSLGIPHECDLETSAGGHSWKYYNHMLPKAFAFMLARLEQERLRVA